MQADPIETGDPATDGRAFRRSLGQYPTGVTIITTMDGDTPVGMAVNSFAAVSLDPPLVLWSIRKESASGAAFLAAGHFGVNILGAEQVEVSQLFGAPSPDRFSRIDWVPGELGSPLVADVIAQFECRLDNVLEGGDHLILIGHVVHHARFPGAPLLFAQGQYGLLSSQAPVEAGSADVEPAGQAPSFTRQLSMTSQHLSAAFQAERDRLGISVGTARVLHRLHEGAVDAETLQHDTMLGQEEVVDALTGLAGIGEVVTDEGLFALTASGQHRADALAERAAAFIAHKLEGISEADIATTRRVLATLQSR